MSLNFFKHFLIVKSESIESSLIDLAATVDKEGVAETAIRQKISEHNERIKMYNDAVRDYEKEQAEADAEQETYNRFMTEAETIQQLLENLEKAKADISTDPNNQAAAAIIASVNESELTVDLGKLLDAVEKRAPILEKEQEEAKEAKAWMDELKIAVDEISADLMNLRKTVDDAKRDIEKAELETERNRKRAEQAEIVAGLRKNGNKFDVAINALKNKAEEQCIEAANYKVKAESLKKPVDATDTIIGKYTSSNTSPASTESLSERMARLKNK